MQALIMLNRLVSDCRKNATIPPTNTLEKNLSIINGALEELLSRFCTATQKRSLVHLYQREFQRLSSITSPAISPQLHKAATLAITQLKEIFPLHFNRLEHVTGVDMQLKQFTMAINVCLFNKSDNCSSTLLNHLLQIASDRALTWYQYDMLENVFHSLQKNEWQQPDPLSLAVECNIDNTAIRELFIRCLKQQIQQSSDSEACIDSLHNQLQSLVPLQVSFSQYAQTLREFLLSWLESQRLAKPAEAAAIPAAHPRIVTSLSVTQLAAFLRLLVNANIITSANQTQLIALFAGSFTTANGTTISSQSLRNKFYSPEPNTISFLKDLSITLLNHARKMAA